MNDQLQQALTTLITSITAGVNSQLPSALVELVTYYRWLGILGMLISALLFAWARMHALSNMGLYKRHGLKMLAATDAEDRDLAKRRADEFQFKMVVWTGVLIAAGIATAAFGFMFFRTLFPQAWILEYLRVMVQK